MLYQETYQAGGDPTKLNISGVIYTRNSYPFLPPPPPGAENVLFPVTLSLLLRS